MSQECTDEALLQLSTEIAGYDRYKRMLGLSDAEIENIDKDPQSFSSVPGKFFATLKKWKSKSIDFDDLSKSTATYSRLIEIAKMIKDGEAIRSVHKACVKYSSKLTNNWIADTSNVVAIEIMCLGTKMNISF